MRKNKSWERLNQLFEITFAFAEEAIKTKKPKKASYCLRACHKILDAMVVCRFRSY